MKKKEIKILGIGNSFSVDTFDYLFEICKDHGFALVLGNLYIGGASVETHIDQIEQKKSDYIYYKNTENRWEEQYNTSLLKGLLDEDWDYITLQQVSYLAGVASSYDEQLDQLIDFVNQHKTNQDAKLLWNMTWAYETGSDHGGFIHYGFDQRRMYSAITKTVQSKILPDERFEMVLPIGTAIQNLRNTIIGDHLTRDGFHLSFDLGRYCAGLCMAFALLKLRPNDVNFIPDNVTKEQAEYAKQAACQAVKKPFEVSL